ncbi:MAG: hypothetical protein EOQ46_12870 [Mesorhizobium sp.]|uniref:rolling circle replication-associated protein n=1 Tax=Mesorhizobium sp. TaxID=1871066 RepID=UPI000FEAA111|nr:hypothetical protein [Mesorhizobium sp.]RWB44802.1 MAG: hypothetical protein EOQ46_12870 [Mesorhizobium sp.]
MDRPERPLTRSDFFSDEDWRRHCLEGGLDPRIDGGRGYSPATSPGHFGGLYNAINGWEPEQYPVRPYRQGGEHLTADQYVDAYEAVATSNVLGQVMNAHVVVAWGTVGLEEEADVAGATERFLEGVRKWTDKVGVLGRWFWVLERGQRQGLHLHLLLHLPRGYQADFKRWASRAIGRISGVEPVNTEQSHTLHVRMDRDEVAFQWRTFRYLFKGLRPGSGIRSPGDARMLLDIADKAGLTLEHQGNFGVKRFGVCRSLAKGARTRHWRHWQQLRHAPNPIDCFAFDDRYVRSGEMLNVIPTLGI